MARRFGHWLCNHHYECFTNNRVWCWRIKNLNRDWICESWVSISIRCGRYSPLPTITTSIKTRRFRSVDLDTLDGDCGHLHGSSAQVKSCGNKSPAPTQCSHLRYNFHFKDSANNNSGFLVRSVAPQLLGK